MRLFALLANLQPEARRTQARCRSAAPAPAARHAKGAGGFRRQPQRRLRPASPAKAFPTICRRSSTRRAIAWRVVNLGISGDTTEGGVSRIDSATSLKPAIVILELGGNDGLRGLPLACTRTESGHDDPDVPEAREREWCWPA